MAEITGGQLSFELEVNPDALRKALTDAEGKLMGFGDVAELAGEKLDNALKGNVVENLKKIGLQSGLTGKDMKNAIKDAEDFVKGMEAGLKGVLDYQTKLGREINKTPPGEAQATLLQEYDAISTKIEEVSLSIENSKKIVQGFKDENVSLATKLRDVKEEMQQLVQLGQKDSEKYSELSAKAKEYTQNIDQLNAEMKALRGSPGLDLFIESVGLASGVFATTQGVMGLLVGESENLDKIMVQMQATMSVAIGLQQIQNALKSDGTVITRVMAVQELARARATDIASASTGRATIAQRLFNLVANANPYILLATAILTVVGAIALYVAATNEAKKQAEDMAELNKKVADSVAEPLIAFKKLQLQWNALGNDLKAKEKFIKDNKDAFEKLGFSVNNATDAENVFVKNSKAMQAALMLRARAAAATEIATEKYKKGLEAQMADEAEKRILKNGNQDEKAWIEVKRKFRELKGFTTLANEAKENFDSANNLITRSFGYDKAGNDLQKNANIPFVTKTENGKTSTTKSKTTTPKSVADEYFPPGSVAEIQKRMAAIDEALSKSNNDKSTELLKTRRIDIALELAAAEKKIRIRSFDEEVDETKKQIELRDKLIQSGYSKEKVDQMLPKVKDKSYIGYLEETEKSLKSLIAAGDNTEQTATSITKIREAIDEFQGNKTFLDAVTDSIEKLKSKFSGSELISQLEKFKNASVLDSTTEAQANSRKLAAEKAIEEENKIIKANYQQFLKEHKSFEEQKNAITEKYNELRKSNEDSNLSPEQKLKVKIDIDTAEASSQLEAFFTYLQNDGNYSKIFTDMNAVATVELLKFRNILVEKLNKAKSDADKIKIGEFIEKIDKTLKERNPMKAIKDMFKAIGDEALSTEQKLAKLQDGIGAIQGYLKDAAGIVDDTRAAFDDLGISTDNAFGDILDDVGQTIEGLSQMADGVAKFAEGFATGNPVAMVAGAVKAIGGAIKAVSGWFNDDKKKEREIIKQAGILKQLEIAYNDLAFAADRAFGSQKYTNQAQLIRNLEQQRNTVYQMMAEEKSKKDTDWDKVRGYDSQVQQINQAITSLKEGIIKDVLQTDVVDAAAKVGDALVDAFGRGEDAAKSLETAANDMIKNLLKNQLNLMLQNKMKPILDNLLAQSGFNQDGTGSFTGLTPEQIAAFKAQVVAAGESMSGFLEAYGDIFAGIDGNQQGLKGDIKGITEKTAGALEAQINAIRIYQVEGLSVQRANQQVFIQSLQNLVLIEFNTRRLHSIDASLAEMNSKMKKGLAGLP